MGALLWEALWSGGSEGRERAEEEAGRDRFQLHLPLPDLREPLSLSSPRAVPGGEGTGIGALNTKPQVSPSLAAYHPPLWEEESHNCPDPPEASQQGGGPLAVTDGRRGEGAAVSSLAAAICTPGEWAWATTSIHC